MNQRTARRLARFAFLLWGLLVATSIVFDLATNPRPGEPSGNIGDVLFTVSTAAFPIVAVLILSRQPTNRIGWILMAIGLGWVIGPESYGEFAISRGLPGGALAIALSSPTWAPPIGLMGTVLLLRFPDGRLLSPRWRKVEVLGLAAISIVFVVILIAPGDLGDSGYADLENPLGVHALRPALDALLSVLFVIPLTIAASAVSLVLRFRRSTGTERLQLKWLTTAAAIMAVIYLIAMVLSLTYGWTRPETPTWVSIIDHVAVTSFMLIPISIGFAILKYRLYDIDLVIKRALVYGALAAFITAVYVGVVVGLGSLIGTRGEPNLPLSIAATALVAIAFQPARARIQRFANRLVYGKRVDPYELLSGFSRRVAGSYALEDVAPRIAQAVAEATGASQSAVWLRLGDELRRVAAHPADDGEVWTLAMEYGSIPEVPDVDRTFPVRHGDELLGALTVRKPPGDAFRPAEQQLVAALAEQAGLMLRNVRLTAELEATLVDVSNQAEELRASRSRIVAARDAERRRLERNIHDGAQQQLVALAVNLKLARRLAVKDVEKARDLLNRLKRDSRQASEDLGELASGIFPQTLVEGGLTLALEAQARKSAIPTEVDGEGIGRFAPEAEAAAYFCILEALQNASKYADASRATVRLRRQGGEVVFKVEDDGRGFDPKTAKKGSGLQNMADRAEALRGTLDVRSSPGPGTVVVGRIPVEAP